MKTIKELILKTKRLPIAKEDREFYETSIRTPDAASRMARVVFEGLDEECFVVVPVDVRNKPMGIQTVAKGGPDSCHVDPRSVFRAAILLGAAGVIVAHNHPSGSVSPSEEDKLLTCRLVSGGKVLGVTILDHLILTEEDHLSLREAFPSLFE